MLAGRAVWNPVTKLGVWGTVVQSRFGMIWNLQRQRGGWDASFQRCVGIELMKSKNIIDALSKG